MSVLKPNRFYFVDNPIWVLKLAADTKNLRAGKQIHAHLVVTTQVSNQTNIIARTNSIINLYAKCGQLSIAHQLFDAMPMRDVVSWSTLMTGYSRNGFATEVIGLFKSMVSGCNHFVPPNEFVLSTVVSSCSDSFRVREGKQCHCFAVKSGLVFHQHVKNSLVHMYSKCSEIGDATRIFDGVSGFDAFSYNSVVSGLLENGRPDEALGVLRTMVSENVKWDSVTYVASFGVCSGLRSLRLGQQIHCKLILADIESNTLVEGSMMDMYGKCGKMDYALTVFERLRSCGVVLVNTIMSAFFQNSYFEEALKVFAKMRLDVAPSEYTYSVALNSTASLSALRHGSVLHGLGRKSGLAGHIIFINSLMNMYSKSGDIEAANNVFLRTKRRDTITWNILISGYAHHGLGREALNKFEEMMDSKDRPNYVTFVAVLSACAHLGLVQQGFYYLTQLMKLYNVDPGLEHHTCIVGLLSRVGRLEEAQNYMRSVTIDWDVVAWRSLLNACYVHRSYDLGRQVAEFIVKMDPKDVGTYLILSNMCAKTREWDGVEKIRNMMRVRKMKKEPGVSWLEIKDTTHVFVSGDSSHPESREIHEKVRELMAEIRPLGYVPDIGSVLHDMEDEQKEDSLCYHSEKLAVAYGLMKTPLGAPIRVIKNIRICDDCHAAIKLVSKLTGRLIIVRDLNRFHQFKDGSCTCADYW